MKDRRGWLWIGAGVLLALLAGLLTFQLTSQLQVSAQSTHAEDGPATVPVVVAAVDLPAYSVIELEQVTLQDVPAHLVPKDALTSVDDAVGKLSLVPVSAGEMLVAPRLVDPTDPDAPVAYTLSPDQVLIAVPATMLMGRLNMLSPGDHIDLAYSQALTFEKDAEPVMTTFLTLQNLEIKGVLYQKKADGVVQGEPTAFLLAVSPQEALIIKYLIDNGAPMDVLVRAPNNTALVEVAPVDEQFLIDYFQLDTDAPDLTR